MNGLNTELCCARMPFRGKERLVTVLYEEGRAVELHAQAAEESSILGNIYLGRIEKTDPQLAAAFVQISSGQRVYMPLSRGAKYKAGEELAVQITQEAQKTKLPKATDRWEIAGEYMVLSSVEGPVNYSRKLDVEERSVLRSMTSHWNRRAGLLFRTRAAQADAAALREEYDSLLRRCEEIKAKALSRTLYTTLHTAAGIQEEILNRVSDPQSVRFLTDDASLFEKMKDFCSKKGIPATLYRDPQLALFRLRNMTTLLDHLTSRTVHLSSGASLIIEQTEAFTVIDVNTARSSSKKEPDEAIARINREAASAAASQIRLRQLSGTILIDFINSRNPDDEQELLSYLRSCLWPDPVPTKAVDFTPLHICEITRKKRYRSLAQQLG